MSPGYSEFAHRGIVPTRKVEERLPEWPTLKTRVSKAIRSQRGSID